MSTADPYPEVMRPSVVILLAVIIAGVAGYRASRLPHIRATVPPWTWPLLWISIGALVLVLPLLWVMGL